MVVRDGEAGIEVYMARRSARSAFMPDAYVFPGGAVDEKDGAERAVARLDRVPEGVEPAFAIAALRELFEEAGMLLADREEEGSPREDLVSARAALASGVAFVDVLERGGWRLCGSALTYYSRWITPPGEMARRFDARFFVARAPEDQAAAADAVEMHDGLWILPSEALARGARGAWTLVFPTVRHLERLAAFKTVSDLEAQARTRRPFAVMPDVNADGGISLSAGLESW